MDVHDESVPEETFGACVDALPQTCVEVLLERDGAVLVARRTNEPAKSEWFWPGGRLYNDRHEYAQQYLDDLEADRERPDTT